MFVGPSLRARGTLMGVGDGARQRAVEPEIFEHAGGFAHFGRASNPMLANAFGHGLSEQAEVGRRKRLGEARKHLGFDAPIGSRNAQSMIRASMPLIMMLRHNFMADARPGSLDTGRMFIPMAFKIWAAVSACGPPARIGTRMPRPATGAMTAPSTKCADAASTCRADARLVAGDAELMSKKIRPALRYLAACIATVAAASAVTADITISAPRAASAALLAGLTCASCARFTRSRPVGARSKTMS